MVNSTHSLYNGEYSAADTDKFGPMVVVVCCLFWCCCCCRLIRYRCWCRYWLLLLLLLLLSAQTTKFILMLPTNMNTTIGIMFLFPLNVNLCEATVTNCNTKRQLRLIWWCMADGRIAANTVVCVLRTLANLHNFICCGLCVVCACYFTVVISTTTTSTQKFLHLKFKPDFFFRSCFSSTASMFTFLPVWIFSTFWKIFILFPIFHIFFCSFSLLSNYILFLFQSVIHYVSIIISCVKR